MECPRYIVLAIQPLSMQKANHTIYNAYNITNCGRDNWIGIAMQSWAKWHSLSLLATPLMEQLSVHDTHNPVELAAPECFVFFLRNR